jgi:hypothetical protein
MTDKNIYGIENGASVTAADDTSIGECRAIYIGGAGNLDVKFTKGGSVVALDNLAIGVWHPMQPWSIQSTTTATLIVRGW